MADSPALVILFSGKRKSGKDHVVGKLTEILGHSNCEVVRLSEPLKKQYAIEHNLDFDKLLDSSSYKEIYRSSMIAWGEEKRLQDPGFFCSLATKDAKKQIWIISDARRRTDLEYFRARFSIVHARVIASEGTRRGRGWNFVAGIDDAESECGLDDENYDLVIVNDGDEKTLQTGLATLTQIAQNVLNVVN